MHEVDYDKLGAIEQEEKPSDFSLADLASATPLPDEYHTPYTGEIYHQHKTPSCGAHAGAYVKNIQEGRTHSPAYLWKRIKQIDGYPADAGTSMEGIFRALHTYGVCSLDLLPNTTLDSLEEYTDPSVITPAMDADAKKSRIGAYGYIYKPTFEQIKRAIYDFKVVIMRIEISADWWSPSWRGSDILPLRLSYPGQGGHFVVGTGFTVPSIEGLNEWGVTWGDDGRLYFNAEYIGRVTYIGTCFDYVEKAVLTRVLKEGMVGTDVGLVQKALKDKGYFLHSVTKTFGPITKKAVMAFQRSHGLKDDGIVGALTGAQLFG